jgi:hypothetical protein
MLRLIAMGILAIPLCAQTAVNPYDLARFIDSHSGEWASLSKAMGLSDLPVLPRCDPSTVWPCSVDVITASNGDFEELANISGGPSNERLLVYALPRLKEIATGSDAENKEWLRSVVARCNETPEKRTLQALLGDKH